MEFKELAKGLVGYQWNLGKTKDVAMYQFWTWAKEDGLDNDGDDYLGVDKCINFKKELWFELGKIMWKNHHSELQDHVKYIHNYIVKPFRVGIIWYAESIQEIYDLSKYLPPPLMNGDSHESANWDFCDK